MEKKNYENPNNSNKIREKSKKNPIQRSNSSLGKTILMYCISENIKNSTGCVYYSDERLTKDPLAQMFLIYLLMLLAWMIIFCALRFNAAFFSFRYENWLFLPRPGRHDKLHRIRVGKKRQYTLFYEKFFNKKSVLDFQKTFFSWLKSTKIG